MKWNRVGSRTRFSIYWGTSFPESFILLIKTIKYIFNLIINAKNHLIPIFLGTFSSVKNTLLIHLLWLYPNAITIYIH